MLESMGQGVPAALAYGRALANAPPDQALDPPTLKAVARGRVVHGAYTRQLGEHIRGQVAESESRCSAAERRRLAAFIDTTLRVRRRFRQEPTEYYYPGLPAIEFYERDEFPWLPEFESATAAIGQELVDILREEQPGFTPYIQYDRAHAARPVARAQSFPALERLPLLRAGQADRGSLPQGPGHDRRGLPPAAGGVAAALAVRDVLGARAEDTHSRRTPASRTSVWSCICRLSCRRAADSVSAARSREWRVGEAWVFDDTIEHEAWNDSDDLRYILICDVWSPRLSPDERTAIAGIIAATDAFNGTVPAAHV